MSRKFVFITVLIATVFTVVYDTAHAQRRRKKVLKEVSAYDLDTLMQPVPRGRQLFHIKIDDEQKKADVSDGAIDKMIYYSEDTTFNNMLTKALLRDVDHMQVMVENMPANGRDPQADNSERILCLRAITQMLAKYNYNVNPDPYYVRKLIANMHDLIKARNEGRSVAFVKENINVYTLDNIQELYETSAPERIFIYTEMGKREPAMMIKRLGQFANAPYADDIIASAAKVLPKEIFNYASSTNAVLSNAVRRSKDPLVQTIVRIASESKSPLKAMPFLYDIYSGKYSIEDIDKITANPDDFYHNLVRLKLENVSMGGDTYTDELAYRCLKYIRDMNDLHEEKDPVRFKGIEKFSPEDLYFIMVYGQDEIYTSSFVGTFNRMMERLKPRTGNMLLDTVHYDKFRTFIRMCAGYNTLDEFLASMDSSTKLNLLRNFVGGLEKGKEDDLEDAVDVADAFGSISDPQLSDFLQNEVKENYERSYKQAKSKKGVIVYGLLATLFEGMKSVDNDEVAAQQSERLNLPPINKVEYKNLVSDSGVVYQQVFFYGDEDGKNSHASFLKNFKDGKWKITESKFWVKIASTAGKPVVIYANLPIPEPEDETAQNELDKYLAENSIKPTIIVHRGHSYHLPSTIDRLKKETRIVVLGSCGGYHNLGTVLDHSPNAHIISSKQTGTMGVNEPIIRSINTQLLEGKDINWITTWKGLQAYFDVKQRAKDKEKFVDYVPPHKNLGAIFIKAYRRMANTEEDEEE